MRLMLIVSARSSNLEIFAVTNARFAPLQGCWSALSPLDSARSTSQNRAFVTSGIRT
ncbi:MAG: hypothetical protein L0Z50_30665 [Verrucomicrobiales bacterium]|nr:hypothetical protein [Verrucomicrobiales bacterium]